MTFLADLARAGFVLPAESASDPCAPNGRPGRRLASPAEMRGERAARPTPERERYLDLRMEDSWGELDCEEWGSWPLAL